MRKGARGYYAAAACFLVLAIPPGNAGCSSGGSSSLSGANGTDYSEANSIAGIVIDDSSNPIAGATIAAYGITTTTASDGTFTLRNLTLPADRATVAAQKSGYFDATTSVVPNPDGQTLLTLMLVKQELIGTLDNANGGTVTDPAGNVTLTFEPDSFVGTDGSTVTEPVGIYTAYFDPDEPNFASQMPGGDFRAIDTTNTEGTLTSYGAIAAEARTSSGKAVQLKSGTATKSSGKKSGCITIPSSMRGSAPDTMPVWILGSVTNKWTTMSTATKTGSQYCFSISALGRINCDIFSRFASLKGRVCAGGKAAGGVTVTINQQAVRTSSDGYYRAIVSSGQSLNITTQYGSTSAGPLQPTTATCAPDIGSCSGAPCMASSNAGGTGDAGAGGAGGVSGSGGASSISKWGCNIVTTVSSGITYGTCTCAFGPAEQASASSTCGTVTACCYSTQLNGVPACVCLSSEWLSFQDCAAYVSGQSGTSVSACPPQ